MGLPICFKKDRKLLTLTLKNFCLTLKSNVALMNVRCFMVGPMPHILIRHGGGRAALVNGGGGGVIS